MNVIEDAVMAAILAKNPTKVYAAYSGGCDSTALLVALNNVVGSLPLVALHVNHGLQVQSDDWENHCVNECHRLGIEIHVAKLKLSASGNTESVAREERYSFFAQFMEENDLLFVGHHLEDQIETSLMRIFQGRGLIQMPDQRKLGKGTLVRPFLNFKPEILRKYISKLDCPWIEDESNNDQSFARNYIRAVVLPSIGKKWPDFANDFNKVLSRTKDVDKVLAGFYEKLPNVLDTSELPKDRGAMQVWMRSFLESKGHFAVSERQIKLFVEKIENSETAVIELDGKIIGHYRGSLYYEPISPKSDSEIKVMKFPYELDIGWGVLILQEVAEKDNHAFYCSGELIIKFGSGNRKIRMMNSSFKKSVKNLLNEKAVPQWRRASFPLIFSQRDLICLPDVGIDISATTACGSEEKSIKATILHKYNSNKV